MNWYMQTGKDGDVVLNNKISYFRNLRNYKFENKSLKDIQEIENLVKSNLPGIGYNLKFLKLKDMDDLTRKSLSEKGLIDEQASDDNISILINDEENICVILNAQNHFNIQVFNSGMQLENDFNLAREIDQKFEKIFDIAKSKKYGYLTTSPMDVGTGMKVQITLHLPGLTKTGNIRKISQTINDFGLNFVAKYIKDSKAIGDIYQISNKQTLGISEDSIINNLKVISEKLVEQERQARKLLGKNQIELEDMIYRKYGIFVNARKLKWEETLNLWSDIKMGIDLGLVKEITDSQIAKIYFYLNPANLQKFFGQNLEAYDREIKRAEMIKQIIKE